LFGAGASNNGLPASSDASADTNMGTVSHEDIVQYRLYSAERGDVSAQVSLKTKNANVIYPFYPHYLW
jgi:hypothetical protein